MNNGPIHRITGVVPGSIASDLGIKVGDALLTVNSQPVPDVFAYRMAMQSENIEVTVRTSHGTQIFEIEKDEEDDLGLCFDEPLMDTVRACTNQCIFCFIDQLPKGLRSSLYFKDDDARMSFLTGNYVTLTNLSDAELDRILSYHLSPLNLSVHTLSPDLRSHMMNNRFAGHVRERIQKIVQNHITVNVQIVLCPGWNDGVHLEETLDGLTNMGPGIASISVVPVGLTRYRNDNGLPDLTAVDDTMAAAILDQVQTWQRKMQNTRGARVVYAADELYLRAGRELPGVADYEDFPQLENGVGMTSLFLHELIQGLADRSSSSAEQRPKKHIHAVTGTDFAPILAGCAQSIEHEYGFSWSTHAVPNRFFGECITVAGLLTASDISDALSAEMPFSKEDIVLIPSTMLRAEGDLFLDDGTVEQLERQLGVTVQVTGAAAPDLLDRLDAIAMERGSI